MNPATLLQIGANQTVVLERDGAQPSQIVLAIGSQLTANAFFRLDMPAPHELEAAINTVEDEVMRVRSREDSDAELLVTRSGLGEWAAVVAPVMPLESVEQLFQRMAFASLGNPMSMAGLPMGREAAAILLILREFMHHLGFASVRVIADPQG